MMKIVNATPMVLKHQIEKAIAKAVADFRRDYPNNTGFTRKCVLNMETMVNLLLSMQGGSLKKELYDAGIDVTASAFVQQRNKLSWTVFEDAFEHFNANCNDVKKYKGYRVLAIDGTTVTWQETRNRTVSCRMPAPQKVIISFMSIRCMMY